MYSEHQRGGHYCGCFLVFSSPFHPCWYHQSRCHQPRSCLTSRAQRVCITTSPRRAALALGRTPHWSTLRVPPALLSELALTWEDSCCLGRRPVCVDECLCVLPWPWTSTQPLPTAKSYKRLFIRLFVPRLRTCQALF